MSCPELAFQRVDATADRLAHVSFEAPSSGLQIQNLESVATFSRKVLQTCVETDVAYAQVPISETDAKSLIEVTWNAMSATNLTARDDRPEGATTTVVNAPDFLEAARQAWPNHIADFREQRARLCEFHEKLRKFYVALDSTDRWNRDHSSIPYDLSRLVTLVLRLDLFMELMNETDEQIDLSTLYALLELLDNVDRKQYGKDVPDLTAVRTFLEAIELLIPLQEQFVYPAGTLFCVHNRKSAHRQNNPNNKRTSVGCYLHADGGGSDSLLGLLRSPENGHIFRISMQTSRDGYGIFAND